MHQPWAEAFLALRVKKGPLSVVFSFSSVIMAAYDAVFINIFSFNSLKVSFEFGKSR